MSNIYDVFEQRKEGIMMLEEGFGYIEPDESIDFDTIEEGLDVLDEMAEDMTNETIKLCAESLVTDMCLEEALYDDFDDFTENDYLSEAIKEKASKAGGWLMDQWRKFKTWIRKAIETVKNFFLNGEQLAKKYSNITTKIQNCEKEIKMDDYNSPQTALMNCRNLVTKLKGAATDGFDIKKGDENYKEKCYNLIGVKDKSALNEKMRGYFIKAKHEETRKINTLEAGVVYAYATQKKNLIDSIKKFEANIDADFKETQRLIKVTKAGESGDDKKDSSKLLKAFNFVFGIKSTMISIMIKCVKKISSNCLAVCKKAIGGDLGDKAASKQQYKADKKAAKKAKRAAKKNAKKGEGEGEGENANEEAFSLSFEDDYDDYGYDYDDDYGYDDDNFDW